MVHDFELLEERVEQLRKYRPKTRVLFGKVETLSILEYRRKRLERIVWKHEYDIKQLRRYKKDPSEQQLALCHAWQKRFRRAREDTRRLAAEIRTALAYGSDNTNPPAA